eukprot:4190610-Alexandrium_andersonii.AAC.1
MADKQNVPRARKRRKSDSSRFGRCGRGSPALREATPTPRAATEGVPDFYRCQAMDQDISPCGTAWTAA